MIMQQRTDGGSWTRVQLMALGVFPPTTGWIDRLNGTDITEAKWDEFKAGRTKVKPSGIPDSRARYRAQCDTTQPTLFDSIMGDAKKLVPEPALVGICGCGNFEPEYGVHQTCPDCGAPWKVVTYLAALHELFTMLVIARQCQDDGR
jgi:hypothetical protein